MDVMSSASASGEHPHTITTPTSTPTTQTAPTARQTPRSIIVPTMRGPWFPGPKRLLRACARAVGAATRTAVRISIFPGADQGAKVYDVSRRR
jgi:hypothetical protein